MIGQLRNTGPWPPPGAPQPKPGDRVAVGRGPYIDPTMNRLAVVHAVKDGEALVRVVEEQDSYGKTVPLPAGVPAWRVYDVDKLHRF